MITEIRFEGYRCFESFEMNGLGRINLLLGQNNSGKTSILEAILILLGQGHISPLLEVLRRRGERLVGEDDAPRRSSEYDIAHLFTGHLLDVGSRFRLSATRGNAEDWVEVRVEVSPEEMDDSEGLFGLDDSIGAPLAVTIRGSELSKPRLLQLSRRGGITADDPSYRRFRPEAKLNPVHFVSTESLTPYHAGHLWQSIALSPAEDMVVRAMRVLDPAIERIAYVGDQRLSSPRARGGFVVKLKGADEPLPIGSMGDGVWRLLVLALAGVQCQDGVLLVDEIDTGLHHTVMDSMWKLLSELTREYRVQVFATTHSSDCVHSLASICQRDSNVQGNVSIQRVETGSRKAVAFSESDIAVVADQGIEIR